MREKKNLVFAESYLRDRPFKLKGGGGGAGGGGVMVFCFVQNIFFGQHES